MGNLYVVAPLRDFWLKVFVGEGQLAGVSALPKPEGPNAEPTLNQGHYLFAYGLPAELIGRELRIAADVSRVNNLPQQGRASITAELWQTIPARFLPPAAQAEAKRPRRLKSFSAEGVFGADSVARITLTIEIQMMRVQAGFRSRAQARAWTFCSRAQPRAWTFCSRAQPRAWTFCSRAQARASTWTLTLLCSLWFVASAAHAQDPGSAPPASRVPPAEAPVAAPTDSEEPPEPTPAPPPAATHCPSTLGTSIPAARPCTPRRPPEVDNVPDVASFKTPESPAFMALGIAPSEIQRPSTPTGLKASLVNGFAAGGSLPILQNFALELAPYWLFPHRKLSYQQVVAEPWAALYRNLALSFASSPLEEEYLGDGVTRKINYGRFAAGLRMTLWPGTPTRSARQCVAYLMHVLQGSAQQRNLAEQEFAAAWRAEHPEPALPEPVKPDEAAFPDPDALDAALDAYEAALLQLRARSSVYLAWEQDKQAAENEFRRRYVAEHAFDDPRFQRCLSDIHAREGFMAEAASAYSFMVPRGDVEDFKQNAFQTVTAWLTLGWVFEDLFTAEMEGSVLGVLRGQRGFAPDDYQESTGVLDAGARLALAYRRFGLAIEGTYRRRTYDNTFDARAREHLYRAALSLDCHLSGGVWLTGTFGKDFGSSDTKPVLALANLQWNFGLDRGVKPDQKVTQ